jgi:hypothetical protein
MDSQAFSALATSTLQQPVRKLQVKIGSGPVIMDGGIAMQSLPVKTASDAFTASLLMMMKHCADIHLTVLEVIGEKYGLDVDDMCETLKEHPRWKQIHIEPVIHDLTQIARETVYNTPKEQKQKQKEKQTETETEKPKKKSVKKPSAQPKTKAKPKLKEIIYE